MEVLAFHMICIFANCLHIFTFHYLHSNKSRSISMFLHSQRNSFNLMSLNFTLYEFHSSDVLYVHFIFSQLVCVVARAMQYPFFSSPYMFQCYLHILILSRHVNCHSIRESDLSLNVLSPHYYG